MFNRWLFNENISKQKQKTTKYLTLSCSLQNENISLLLWGIQGAVLSSERDIILLMQMIISMAACHLTNRKKNIPQLCQKNCTRNLIWFASSPLHVAIMIPEWPLISFQVFLPISWVQLPLATYLTRCKLLGFPLKLSFISSTLI